ncbi:hypothetical protein AB0K05_12435 [Nonomuraea sp. NPDC049486]|uniref:hypothetical protein n=1 Tax=unclassified Nonomuraea TaxID=2593643 RepID=UPI0011CE2868|nr:hypothetical protein [Nonomuraea sp. C10]TXK34742.1 hypothetical protein FR742_36060 [Nonomuraea sp. C10]
MTNQNKTGAFARTSRRIAAAVVVAAASLAIIGTAAQAKPRYDDYYPCWVEDYGWMYCKDVG